MTVSAILDATIHILLESGLDRFSTTKVAERAGASVGSLYQYFPNREALLVSALERHLTAVVGAVEVACQSVHGADVRTIVNAFVDAFFDAKFADLAASRALYSVSAEAEGAELVRRLSLRAQYAVCDALATSGEGRFRQLTMVGFVICTSVVGPVQAGLESGLDSAELAELRNHIKCLLGSYVASVMM